MYASISKCNAKSCKCCKHLSTKSTVTSSVNGRQFSVINNLELDWNSEDLIYVLTWNLDNCKMQYVGQTGRSLKKRFGVSLLKNENFLYRHFKRKDHTPANILVQAMETIHTMQIQQ